MLGSAEGQAVLVLDVEPLDIEAGEEGMAVRLGQERVLGVVRPRVAIAEQVDS
jgi:hypothetical protein